MSFPRYPEYKDSGVEWLGEVPAHWSIHQLKRCVNGCVNGIWGSEPEPDGENTIVIRVADFDRQKLLIKDDGFTYRFIEEKEKITRLLKKGDLLLEKSGGGEKTLVGQVVLFDKDFPAVTSNFVAKLTPIKAYCSQYLNYVFMHFYSLRINYCAIKQNTGIQNIDSDAYLSERFSFPEKNEQEVIANFLNHEAAKIDKLISEQEKLIALLKEKRQAVISHAVTKGLNPNVKMKDSGIEWLGEVPAHWDVLPLKRNLQFLTSGSRGWAEHYSDEGSLFIRIGNLTRDGIGLDLSDIQRVTVPDGSEGERTRLRYGDVLFSITAYLGSVAVVPKDLEPAYISQHVALARLNQEKAKPEWVAYVTLSDVGKIYLESQGYGGTKIQLGLDDVANIIIPLPQADEQEEIITALENQLARFAELTIEAEAVIDILKERRSALISAAVTGKIDVRQAITR